MKNLYLTTIFCAVALMNCNAPSKPTESTDSTDTTNTVAATAATMNTELLETHWKLVELNGQAVTNPAGNQKEAYSYGKLHDCDTSGHHSSSFSGHSIPRVSQKPVFLLCAALPWSDRALV